MISKNVAKLILFYELIIIYIQNRTLHKLKIHRPDDMRIFCKLCGSEFLNKGDLQRHISFTHEKKRDYVCEICGQGCAKPSQLYTHKLTHSKFNPFICKVIKLIFF